MKNIYIINKKIQKIKLMQKHKKYDFLLDNYAIIYKVTHKHAQIYRSIKSM